MVIVQKKGQGSKYDFTVSKQRFIDALLYKILNYAYNKDVQVDYNAVEELPENAIYISHIVNYGLRLQIKSNIYTPHLGDIYKKKTWNLNYLQPSNIS